MLWIGERSDTRSQVLAPRTSQDAARKIQVQVSVPRLKDDRPLWLSAGRPMAPAVARYATIPPGSFSCRPLPTALHCQQRRRLLGLRMDDDHFPSGGFVQTVKPTRQPLVPILLLRSRLVSSVARRFRLPRHVACATCPLKRSSKRSSSSQQCTGRSRLEWPRTRRWACRSPSRRCGWLSGWLMNAPPTWPSIADPQPAFGLIVVTQRPRSSCASSAPPRSRVDMSTCQDEHGVSDHDPRSWSARSLVERYASRASHGPSAF
ncbi:hypothetical protein C8Q76DRAFT_298601 [Earliella scabrosa]|nr:hypothetical protein C8Q76DRAFT_298601 [Earliella scabrosa]